MRYRTSRRTRAVTSRRSRLYRLLAAAHSGPLGQALAETIRQAAALFAGEPLPEAPTVSRAELYREVYGLPTRDPGAASTHPLPAKLTHLAGSAGRTAQGRAHEAASIEAALGASGYFGLLSLTHAVVQADATISLTSVMACRRTGVQG